MKKSLKITLKSIGLTSLSTLAAFFWIIAIVSAALIIKYSIEDPNILSKKEFREAAKVVIGAEFCKGMYPNSEICKVKYPNAEICGKRLQRHMNAKFSKEELNIAQEHFEAAFMTYCLQKGLELFIGDRAGWFVPDNHLKGIFKEWEFTILFEQGVKEGLHQFVASFLELSE